MGCYNCGSEKGTDTKLCPECREGRARARRIVQHRQKADSKWAQTTIGTISVLCVIAFIGYNLHQEILYSKLPPHEKLYRKCLKKRTYDAKKAERSIREIQRSNGNFSIGWDSVPSEYRYIGQSYQDPAVGIREVTLAMGKAECLQLRNDCERDISVCNCPFVQARYR